MRIAIIAFSENGAALGMRLNAFCEHEVKGYLIRRHVLGNHFEPFDSVHEITTRLFYDTDALIFIGACGIVVRAIAPHIKSKLTDPAVVVCDETGRFAVSLLAGHVGGANRLTEEVAAAIGAIPVITTASDASAVTDGVLPVKNLVLGIGCRRGISAEIIERTVTILLWDHRIPLVRVVETATIDVKKEEDGLLRFAAAHELPLRFYTASELAAVQGEFTSSERVLHAVGVDNVCERAAVLCGGKGKLILKKNAKDGVTVAVFEKE